MHPPFIVGPALPSQERRPPDHEWRVRAVRMSLSHARSVIYASTRLAPAPAPAWHDVCAKGTLLGALGERTAWTTEVCSLSKAQGKCRTTCGLSYVCEATRRFSSLRPTRRWNPSPTGVSGSPSSTSISVEPNPLS